MEDDRQEKITAWKDILSPRKMALRAGALGGIFTAILTAIAEVPIVHSVARCAIAVILFTFLGLAAGYVLSSLDIERLIVSSEFETGEYLEFLDEESPSPLVDDEDILNTEIYADEELEPFPEEKSKAAASALKSFAGSQSGLQALPEPTAQEVLPDKTVVMAEDELPARRSRKLVVAEKTDSELGLLEPKARRSRKLVLS